MDHPALLEEQVSFALENLRRKDDPTLAEIFKRLAARDIQVHFAAQATVEAAQISTPSTE